MFRHCMKGIELVSNHIAMRVFLLACVLARFQSVCTVTTSLREEHFSREDNNPAKRLTAEVRGSIKAVICSCAVRCSMVSTCQTFSLDADTALCSISLNDSPARRNFMNKVTYKKRQKQTAPCSQDGYSKVPDLRFCFKVHANSVTYNKARRICRKEGGMLISLNSEKKHRHVYDHVLRIYTPKTVYLWVGMRRRKEGPYTWFSRNKINFMKWAPSDPNYGTEACVLLSAKGLADVHCFEMHPSICEIALLS